MTPPFLPAILHGPFTGWPPRPAACTSCKTSQYSSQSREGGCICIYICALFQSHHASSVPARRSRTVSRERERERERERFNHMSIRPTWPMRTSHCSCLSQLKDGCQAIRNILLVLVPHTGAHGTTTTVIQISILSSNSIKKWAFKTEMALITNSSERPELESRLCNCCGSFYLPQNLLSTILWPATF